MIGEILLDRVAIRRRRVTLDMRKLPGLVMAPQDSRQHKYEYRSSC